MNKYSLIIPAGGTSTRYGSKNKLLELINNKTVIEITVSRFTKFNCINEIIIPANAVIYENLKNIFADNKCINIIKGGKTRQESVYNALQYITNEYVLIHDAARPLVSEDIIKNVLETVIKKGAVTVMSKTTDTIKEVADDGKIIKTIDREKLYNTQTPQAFKSSVIKQVHSKLAGKAYTDDSSMLEELEIPVYAVIGDSKNIKITTKSDLDFAKIYI